MKGRYGIHMTTYGSILPRAALVARLAEATPKTKKRLKILDWYREHGKNISLTSRRFGIQRLTLRRWIKKIEVGGISGLNDHSHRPKHLRASTTPWETVAAVVNIRKRYPAWSKYKIRTLLDSDGIKVSASTIGRILKRRELIGSRISMKRKHASLEPRLRFQRGLKIANPGDLVQIDTKYIMLPNGNKLYQFTAIDVLTKIRVLRIYKSQSSRNGKDFLETCFKALPFLIKAVQTDNGAPFLKEFDQYCQKINLTHYFIYPRTPKQNTYVENSHGSDQREFYQLGNKVKSYDQYPLMQKRILDWEKTWNEIRPHQALNYLTPKAYFIKWQTGRLPTKDIITLQT